MLEVKFIDSFNDEASAICVFVSEDLKLSKHSESLDKKLGGVIGRALKALDNFKGKHAQVKSLTAISKGEKLHQVYLVGTGKDKELTESKIEALGATVSGALRSSREKSGFVEAVKLGKFDDSKVAALLASGAVLGSYNFNKYHTTKKPEELPVLKNIEIYTSSTKEAKAEFEPLLGIAKAIYAARDVITEPGNIIFPESYSLIIKEKLEPLGVEVEILGEKEMKKLGMGSLLGVGQGSMKESKLVVMTYFGKDKKTAPVALVGKGVTFDTGGISLKPPTNMHEMKYDMSGSAAVFGTMMALAARKAKVNVVGVVGLVENMPGGNAQRPGDVVTSMSGQTIEVLNTDAEGRLVLADAMWYTQDRFKPSIMIDLATLTGAIRVALGTTYGGLFSNDDKLADRLLEAGKATGEELWRMPLHADYDKMIKSDIADLANIGNAGGLAGSNTAAQFLEKFVNKVTWAHLDIAGVADSSKGTSLSPKGAVGFGIRLLNKLIKDHYED